MSDQLTYNQRYYRDNQERERARVKAYKSANKDKVKETNKRRYITEESRSKTSEATKRWAQENPERYATIKNLATIRHRLKKHGLTLETYEEMLSSQDYRCAICKRVKVGNRRNGKHGAKRTLINGWPSVAQQGDFSWHVDHDHKTGKVRGLLCHHCNTALGHVCDDANVLMAMIKYLKEN